MKLEIEYNNKIYPLKEPTITTWLNIMNTFDDEDEKEVSINLINQLTDLTRDEVLDCPFEDVLEVSNALTEYLNVQQQQFHKEIVFKDKTYRFVNLDELKFGEFIDLDEFLKKPENERRRELNMLMSMLYRELDENGTPKKYDTKEMIERANLFKELPIKYTTGAMKFFFYIERTLPINFQTFSKSPMMMKIQMLGVAMRLWILINIGAGLERLSNWRMKILQKWKK